MIAIERRICFGRSLLEFESRLPVDFAKFSVSFTGDCSSPAKETFLLSFALGVVVFLSDVLMADGLL